MMLKIGLLGAGWRGAWLAHEVEKSGLGRVVAAHDTNRPFAETMLKRLDLKIPFVERESILNDASLDGVIVATPDDCHRHDACDLLRSGRPVLSEKPMAIHIEDCDAMLKVQHETGQSLQIGFNLRFHPLYQKMREIAASGKLGKITTVWVRHFVGLGGDFYFHDWHSVRDKSTSLLLQKATHDFDVIHFVTGAYTRRLVALGNRAYYGGDRDNELTCPACPDLHTCPEANRNPDNPRNECAFRKEIDVEDNEMVLLELENGILANYSQCHFTPDYHRNYVFIGTKGRMESFEPMRRVKGWQDDCRIEILYRNSTERETIRFDSESPGHGGADIRMIENWLAALRDGVFDRENPIAGRQSVAVGCLAAESLRNGNPWMSLPPVLYDHKKGM
ncbi:MAG: Gfo/Idh/MocA family oxidoreductase [Methylacidiphilales bacterium]|nr:Gfo/Idh/MocA family oxidoreductase [Candidatus Methylacidiphilales bacterium]